MPKNVSSLCVYVCVCVCMCPYELTKILEWLTSKSFTWIMYFISDHMHESLRNSLHINISFPHKRIKNVVPILPSGRRGHSSLFCPLQDISQPSRKSDLLTTNNSCNRLTVSVLEVCNLNVVIIRIIIRAHVCFKTFLLD